MQLARYAVLVLALTTFLPACGTVAVVTGAISASVPETEPYVRPPPEFAIPAGPNGAFASIESGIRSKHGPEASGFELIDSNEDGLRWRLALIDTAKQSIDIQYYLWYGDAAGRLLTKRLLDAADRGVKVRVLVDDLNTAIQTATSVSLRDKVAVWMDHHPNMQVRVFNPWKKRDLAARLSESIFELKRVNQRMHNKALIVDNQAVILGGRNLGDEYMGLNSTFNFHDLDVLGIGPVARQTSAIFDSFWNSAWSMPVWALKIPITPAEEAAGREKLLTLITNVASLGRFPLPAQSWSTEFEALPHRWHIGSSRVYSDLPKNGTIDQLMIEKILALIASPQQELLIVNAYIIPTERGMETLRTLKNRGVRTRILTNSLASQDVPAVNSHYKPWRKPILEAGAELYEIRHDAAIQSLVSDTPPTRAKFMGLHSKGMVIDREEVFIGSMNLDPRSALINTEMGVVIKSRGLAEALAKLIERDMEPANSWRVELNNDGDLRWVNDKETVTMQPARNCWQRVEDVFFELFPKEYY